MMRAGSYLDEGRCGVRLGSKYLASSLELDLGSYEEAVETLELALILDHGNIGGIPCFWFIDRPPNSFASASAEEEEDRLEPLELE